MIHFGDRSGFRVQPLHVPCPALERPLKILHLSDTHLLPGDRRKLEFVQRVTDADYDFVFHTGDVAETPEAEPLVPSMLTRQPRHGAYLVPGNHDHLRLSALEGWGEFLLGKQHGPERLTDVARMKANYEAGGRWRVLLNERAAHTIDEREVVVAGVDDPWSDRGDLQATMHGLKRADVLIGLVHVPTDLASFAQRGFHLVLAGHTHGGQVRLPLVGALRTQCDLPNRLARGLHYVESTAVHVSQGLGAGKVVRVRVLCPPTAYVITLGG